MKYIAPIKQIAAALTCGLLTLTLYVRVRILLPLPLRNLSKVAEK